MILYGVILKLKQHLLSSGVIQRQRAKGLSIIEVMMSLIHFRLQIHSGQEWMTRFPSNNPLCSNYWIMYVFMTFTKSGV
jgi:hypothetical protein